MIVGTTCLKDTTMTTETLQETLLTSGYLTLVDIVLLRNGEASAFVAFESCKNRLFTVVDNDGRVLVPQILLDADGKPTAVSDAVRVLVPLGLKGWELWAWLASPSGWLSGEVPADVFATDPERAMMAVNAYASSLLPLRED